ncbi:hypothetical protein ACMFMG_001488 [Clarireedia jacksonii]
MAVVDWRAMDPVQDDLPENYSGIEGFFVSGNATTTTEGFFCGLDCRTYRVMHADSNGTGDVLFPIHDACLELVDRALRFKNAQTPMSANPITLETFWNALCKRYSMMMEIRGQRSSNPRLRQDYGYYGLEWEHDFFGAREFQDYNGWVGAHGHEWLCADPLQVPPLTTFALGLLSPISPQDTQSYAVKPRVIAEGTSSPSEEEPLMLQKSEAYLQDVPVEIVRRIASYLSISSIFALRLSCRKLASMIPLDPQFWYERLIQYSLIPYVWDLDIAACAAKNAQLREVVASELEPGISTRWDWKRLAHRLSRMDNYISSEEVMSTGVPFGFRNRCRIWKIIDRALELES